MMNNNLDQSAATGVMEYNIPRDENVLGGNTAINLNNFPSLPPSSQSFNVNNFPIVNTIMTTESDLPNGSMSLNGPPVFFSDVACTIPTGNANTAGAAEVGSTSNDTHVRGSTSPLSQMIFVSMPSNIGPYETQSNGADVGFQAQNSNFNANSIDGSNMNIGTNVYGFLIVGLSSLPIYQQNEFQYSPQIMYNIQNNAQTDPNNPNNNILQYYQPPQILVPVFQHQTQVQDNLHPQSQSQFWRPNQYHVEPYSQQVQMLQQQPTLQSQSQFDYLSPNIPNQSESQYQNHPQLHSQPQSQLDYSFSNVTNQFQFQPDFQHYHQSIPQPTLQSQIQFDYLSPNNSSQSESQCQNCRPVHFQLQTQQDHSFPIVTDQSQFQPQVQHMRQSIPQLQSLLQSQSEFDYLSPTILNQPESQRQYQDSSQVYSLFQPQFSYSSPNITNHPQLQPPVQNILQPMLLQPLPTLPQSQSQFGNLYSNVGSHEYNNNNTSRELFYNHNAEQETSPSYPNIYYFNGGMEQHNGAANDNVGVNINVEHDIANPYNVNNAELSSDIEPTINSHASMAAPRSYYFMGSTHPPNMSDINEFNNNGMPFGTDSDLLPRAYIAPQHTDNVIGNYSPPNERLSDVSSTQQQPTLIGYMTPEGFITVCDMNPSTHN